MKLYEVEVTETRIYSITYTVEAISVAGALEKADLGDTVDESDGRVGEVIDRLVVGPAIDVTEEVVR